MANPINLEGQKFGRLLAVKRLGLGRDGCYEYQCQCDCGATLVVSGSRLKSGNKKSCGCLKRDLQKPLYANDFERILADRLHSMKQRCYNPSHCSYPYYGGLGVTVCQEWLNSTRAFIDWSMANGFRPEYEIDRYPDKCGPYAPWNCRWVDKTTNQNNRRCSVYVTAGGKTLTMAEWEKILHLAPGTLFAYKRNHGYEAMCDFVEGYESYLPHWAGDGVMPV